MAAPQRQSGVSSVGVEGRGGGVAQGADSPALVEKVHVKDISSSLAGSWRGGREERDGAEVSAVATQVSKSKSSSSSSAQLVLVVEFGGG